MGILSGLGDARGSIARARRPSPGGALFHLPSLEFEDHENYLSLVLNPRSRTPECRSRRLGSPAVPEGIAP